MKITVIVPTYKRLDYLAEAINSIIEQTHTDWECLIVNDHPPDAIAISKLLASFKDDRLHLINHETSLGGNAARNSGIARARGEIIAFLDDDDLWLPDKLQKHLACHQDSQAGVVFSGVTQQWEGKKLPAKTTLAANPAEDVLTAMSKGEFCPHTTSAVTVARWCFDHCGTFDSKLVSFQDWDMWYRLAAKGVKFDCISEPLIIFRQHLGARTSKSIERRLRGLEMLLDKWQGTIKNSGKFRQRFTKESYIALTNDSILQGKKKQAFRSWISFLPLIDRPFDVLQAIKLLLMITFNNQLYGQMLQTYRTLNPRQPS